MSNTNVQLQTDNLEQTEIEISVIVPFYNAEKRIEDCIKALLAQSYPSTRCEIIMIDNNSTDSSAELVRKYPQIKLLSEQKQGSYAARNQGVSASQGTIIAFTDADCVPSTDWLQKIIASMRSPGVELVQGRRIYAIDTPTLSMLAAYESERAAYTFSAKSRGIYYGYTNNMAVRRDLFGRCGPFPEIKRGADTIFVLRVIEHYSCEAVSYEPDACIRHSEITSVWNYLHKKCIYGISFQENYSLRKESHRPMTVAERFGIIKRTLQRNRYSRLQTLHLIILVWMGMLCFKFGRLSVICRAVIL